MKRNLLVLFVLLIVGTTAVAQTEKGNWLVGGNIEFNTEKNNTQIDLLPSAGYFFANNFAAGANLIFDYTKIGDDKVTQIGIGPFARYYFKTVRVKPFAHANVGFTSTKNKSSAGTSTYTGVNYFLGAGIAAFLNRNVALEGIAGYSHTAFEHQEGSGGFNLRVGFQVYLGQGDVAKITTK